MNVVNVVNIVGEGGAERQATNCIDSVFTEIILYINNLRRCVGFPDRGSETVRPSLATFTTFTTFTETNTSSDVRGARNEYARRWARSGPGGYGTRDTSRGKRQQREHGEICLQHYDRERVMHAGGSLLCRQRPGAGVVVESVYCRWFKSCYTF